MLYYAISDGWLREYSKMAVRRGYEAMELMELRAEYLVIVGCSGIPG